MAVYYYLSAKDDRSTQRSVLAYTHDDVFKPIPGFKVVSGHFHWTSMSNFATSRPWITTRVGFRFSVVLGINVVYLGDFHDDSDPRDPGPKRLMEQKVYFEGTRRVSDKNFLVIPAEEVEFLSRRRIGI